MDLVVDYTLFHDAKPYFPTFSIQLYHCKERSIIQNCLCGYNHAIGSAWVGCHHIKRTKTWFTYIQVHE